MRMNYVVVLDGCLKYKKNLYYFVNFGSIGNYIIGIFV